jgi:transcriptional regulator with XRE-family HTH domain
MDSTIGARLRFCRDMSDLSLSELGRKAGLSKGAISMAETGKTMLNSDSLARICHVLKVSPDFILNGIEVQPGPEWGENVVSVESLSLRQAVMKLHGSQKLSRVYEGLSGLTSDQIDMMMDILEVVVRGRNSNSEDAGEQNEHS